MSIFMNKIVNTGSLLLSFLAADMALSADKATPTMSGTLMFDYGLLSDEGLSTEIRRARLSFKHELNKDWSGKMQLSFDEEDQTSEIKDAYVRFKGFEHINITMGKMKEPFGLENMTSSKNITFLERSMASNAFAPGRNRGFMLSGSPGDATWSVAFMDLDSDNTEDNPYAITGRSTWAPVRDDNQTLHLGFSGSLRQLYGDDFEIEERIELHQSDKIIDTSKIETQSLQLTGVEAAWVNGPLLIQSEYMRAELQAVDSSENADFDGYYLQASYFLSSEVRAYKKGAFSGVKPRSKKGAWELTSRYSVLNTHEASDTGNVQTQTLGLNYYYDKNLRLMGNLLHAQSSSVVEDRDTWNGASFRLQYLF